MHSFSTLLRFIWRSSRRAAVFLVGVALVGVGLVMFVTPGPGIVLVVAGLAVLATEFAWAEHLLDKAKTSAAKAGRSAQKLPGVSRATSAAGRLVPARWRRRGDAGDAASDAPTASAEVADAARVVDAGASTGPADVGDDDEHDAAPAAGDAGVSAPDPLPDGEPTHR